MPNNPSQQTANDGRKGLIAGVTAYTIWGLFPVYFILTKSVPAFELVGHRIIWSVPFCCLLLLLRKQMSDVLTVIKDAKLMGLLTIAAIIIAANWAIFIWAVQHGQIFQSSLGYYINPLLYVGVGVLFFKETLSPLQVSTIICAAIGVLILTIYGGTFPLISIALSVTFTIYGVVKRLAAVRAMTGLFVETALLFLPALAAMIYYANQGVVEFTQQGLSMDVLIILAGPLTVLPLVAFSFAARRIKMSTLGIIQFISPTLQFLCGLYFGETLSSAHIICFIFIWLGVFIFSWDAIRKSRAS